MVNNNINGIAKKYDGTAIDYVSIFNWNDGKCIAQVVPDISGNWQYNYTEDLQVGLTYVADGCEPITHGSYYFEFLGDEYAGNVVALLHFDGDLTDETGITWSANNNPAYDAGVFNNAIKLQSSSKQCVYSSNGIADFGSSDFTVEFFINFQNFNAEACVLTGGWNYSAGKRTWGFLLGGGLASNQMYFYCSSNGSTSYICSIITSRLSVNTTYHVAAVREGSTFRLFLNGMLVGTSTSNASIYSDLSSGVTVGSFSQSETNSSYYADAWFDELRITKGVARYTENFTPPTEPFPF